jgi:hypothetical protein
MSILVLTSDTLIGTPATGNIEYNGQFFGTDSNASRAQLQRIVQATAVASTSGTSIDFTGLPSWIKRVTVMFSGVSLSGTANPLIQIGAGSVTTSGYISSGAAVAGAGSTGMLSSTTGFVMNSSGAANVVSGHMVITTLGSNVWVSSHSAKYSTTFCLFGGGDITLGGTLDRVRITTTNGTDTFDAGSINIMYEG